MGKLIERKKIIGAIIVMILVTATVGIGVYDFGVKTGSLEIDGSVEDIKTNMNTVGELLKEKEIELSEEDSLSPGIDEDLKEGFEIAIKRAVPVVITVGGNSEEVVTGETTVKDVLDSKGIYYDKMDRVAPGLDTEVAPHMEIEVVRVTELSKTLEQEISYESETKENSELEEGKVNTIQAGAKGLKSIEIKETYENKELVKSEKLEETVTKEPVKEILEKGTKKAVVVTRSATSRSVPSTTSSTASEPVSAGGNVSGSGIIVRASAYSASDATVSYTGLTAMGTKARAGVIAVDPNVIPLGTKVYIEYEDGTPWGYCVAEDTGGAIKGNKIDIFMDSSQVWNFGVRNMRVYIVN